MSYQTVENSEGPDPLNVTWGEFVNGTYLPFYRRKWKTSTKETNEARLSAHLMPLYKMRRLVSFRRDELQDMLDAKARAGLSYSVIAHLRWDLRQILRMAVEEELLSRNAAELLFVPREAKRPEHSSMNFGQIRTCLEVLQKRERLIVKFAVLAGLRPGEILALQWRHLLDTHADIRQRIYRGRIDTPKTRRSTRNAALSSGLLADIGNWKSLSSSKGPDDWVFPANNGKTPLSRDNFLRRYMAPALAAVGLGWVDFQVMRRTHATLMNEIHDDPKLVADQLGHTLDVNQNVYTRVSLMTRKHAVDELEAAIEMGKMPLTPEICQRSPTKPHNLAKLGTGAVLMLDFSTLPEVFVSNADLAPMVSRETKQGRLLKIGSRIYTRNFKEPAERIVQRNLWPLVASYLPGALIADRTALENRPAPDGSVFVIAEHKRDIAIPGVTLRPRKGPPPLQTDRQFIGTLRIASPARAFLENMRPSRARSGVGRTLSRRDIEERLDEILRRGGETALQRLRDEARQIVGALSMEEEFQRLDTIIGCLLGTRKATLESPLTVARAAGLPYDPHRLNLFQKLFSELAGSAPVTRLARQTDGVALPFFEAYFSNFIEGTEFAIEEAEDIIFNGHIPKSRPADAHDVIGTWKTVSDTAEMSQLPRSFEELLALLKGRHAQIMEGRPDKEPGIFKSDPNRAGATLFVAPELVPGTLAKGYELYRGLSSPLNRAVFIMFMISEVHPFADGNGRVARIMMNAELVSVGENRIIVPTVYRNNYLVALKGLSHNGNTGAIVRTMDFAQRYTAAIDFSDLERARFALERTNAFADPNEADASGMRLILPTPDILSGIA